MKSPRTPLKRSAIKRKPQSKEDFARKYGSKERVAWIRSLPCSACGVVGYSENAHVAPASEKGTGYKAGFEWIVPLCGHRWKNPDFIGGCHELYDEHRWIFDARFPDFNASTEASKCEQAWKAHQEERK